MSDELENQDITESEPLASETTQDVNASGAVQDASDYAGHDTSPVSEQQAAFNWREALQQAGIPVQGNSDEEAAQWIRDTYQRMLPLAQTGYQVRPHLNEFQRWRQQQQAQPQAPAPQPSPLTAEQTRKKWDALKYDPSWQSAVAYDANGNLIPKNGYDVEPVKNLQEYNNQLRERLQQLASNPWEPVQPFVEDFVQSKIQEALNAERERQQQYQFSAQTIGSFAPFIYEAGQDGSPQVDPLSGRPVLSKFGNDYARAVEEVARAGITNPMLQHRMAIGTIMEPYLLQQQQQRQAPAQPQQTSQEKLAAQQQDLIARTNGTARRPNRTGTVQVAERTDQWQNDKDSLFRTMMRTAREQGVL